ncbi:hypothetical protein WJ969_05280 [Achromobacter xylosoxidans]
MASLLRFGISPLRLSEDGVVPRLSTLGGMLCVLGVAFGAGAAWPGGTGRFGCTAVPSFGVVDGAVGLADCAQAEEPPRLAATTTA